MSAASQDTEDLEALFDEISSQQTPSVAAMAEPADDVATSEPVAILSAALEGPIHGPEQLFDRVGRLTRGLHDALSELGYGKAMEKVVDALPDARDRLTYISSLTQGAAERALEAVETAKPIQEELSRQARALGASWQRVFDGQLPKSEFRELALTTHAFLEAVPEKTDATEKKLLDIMMAQDFHDLTGQVIKKIVGLAHTVEQELLQLLVAARPEERQAEVIECGFAGPVVRPEGRTDVVTNQAQVDDLLEQLGF